MGTAESKRKASGFTLLEILVVVAIVAILTGFAVLRLRATGADEGLDTELRRLAALTDAACEQAILQARTLGLRFTSEGYDFQMAADGGWTPLGDRRFRAREFPDPAGMTLDVEGHRVSLAREPGAPQIVCTGTGELTAFEFTMTAGGASRRLTAPGHGDLRIE